MNILTVYLHDIDVMIEIKKRGWLKPYEVWITSPYGSKLNENFWTAARATRKVIDLQKLLYTEFLNDRLKAE